MKTSTNVRPLGTWHPTPQEVAAVLDQMRPIINQFAARDRRQLDEWAKAA